MIKITNAIPKIHVSFLATSQKPQARQRSFRQLGSKDHPEHKLVIKTMDVTLYPDPRFWKIGR